MKRLWILFKTEFNVWRHDPITAMGGIVPCFFILVAFALLFGGRLSFPIAVINQDEGKYGQILVDTFEKAISPLDNAPYYAVQDMDEADAWQAYEEYRIEGIWVIPADFSARLAAGNDPAIEMYFMNYNDDRAKNHRIYSAEVLWQFYQDIGLPGPPMTVREEYPLPEMVDWVSIISVGIVLLSVTLGAIFNMFILTYKAQTGQVTLEYGLSPRSLG
ncbi:MAG: ABC transporter permease, partial [Anaerolineales bacterium]